MEILSFRRAAAPFETRTIARLCKTRKYGLRMSPKLVCVRTVSIGYERGFLRNGRTSQESDLLSLTRFSPPLVSSFHPQKTVHAAAAGNNRKTCKRARPRIATAPCPRLRHVTSGATFVCPSTARYTLSKCCRSTTSREIDILRLHRWPFCSAVRFFFIIEAELKCITESNLVLLFTS